MMPIHSVKIWMADQHSVKSTASWLVDIGKWEGNLKHWHAIFSRWYNRHNTQLSNLLSLSHISLLLYLLLFNAFQQNNLFMIYSFTNFSSSMLQTTSSRFMEMTTYFRLARSLLMELWFCSMSTATFLINKVSQLMNI